ncbi:hypothetical protein SUBVAR_06661 [Subdoligranulum variabile DSM 15176]|uniref:Uncharacterized protein n=1 Tax=Subdoligranulum variabile DSM 15176 TaxID=411471 RepID=D1PQJ2_9FIRM|nr:hypothetical protein SUBVAR_06661 [Subdoligranulum variabile DSM 15176]
MSTPFFSFFDKFRGRFLVIRYSVLFGVLPSLLQFASYYNSIKAS